MLGEMVARRVRRLFVAGLALSAAGCVAPAGSLRPGGDTSAGYPGPGTVANTGQKIAVLLPLTGPAADVGKNMLQAVQLALPPGGAPELVQQDTRGSAEGAAAAAQAAIASGAGIIIGPLTAPETAAVAPIARAANVPVLAFTSDSTQGQPGVWALGIAPDQQMRRLMTALAAEHTRTVVAVLPQNILGDAMATGIIAGAKSENLPEPRILRSPPTVSGFTDSIKTAAGYMSLPGGSGPGSQADTQGLGGTTESARQAAGGPPQNALVLGASGDAVGAIAPTLAGLGIAPGRVRVLGPGTWARDAARQPDLVGAWYAAPDPAARARFAGDYATKFKAPARDLSSIAFDAANVAQAAMTRAGVSIGAIVRQGGFSGADGPISFAPDGTVRRGLGVFEVVRGGSRLVQPPLAPTS